MPNPVNRNSKPDIESRALPLIGDRRPDGPAATSSEESRLRLMGDTISLGASALVGLGQEHLGNRDQDAKHDETATDHLRPVNETHQVTLTAQNE